jgi:hypothetical protein
LQVSDKSTPAEKRDLLFRKKDGNRRAAIFKKFVVANFSLLQKHPQKSTIFYLKWSLNL